jgi:hypothetical protein
MYARDFGKRRILPPPKYSEFLPRMLVRVRESLGEEFRGITADGFDRHIPEGQIFEQQAGREWASSTREPEPAGSSAGSK